MHRFLLAAVGAACLAVVACNGTKTTPPGDGDKPPVVGPDTRDIGTQLYDAPFRPAKAGERPVDPISLPQAQALVLDKLDLAAKVDGTIWWIGLETTQAEASAAGLEKVDLYTHPRTKKLYRRLKPGDDVTPGQVLVFMDDSRAYSDLETAEIALRVARDEADSAVKTGSKLKEVEDRTREGYNRGPSRPSNCSRPRPGRSSTRGGRQGPGAEKKAAGEREGRPDRGHAHAHVEHRRQAAGAQVPGRRGQGPGADPDRPAARPDAGRRQPAAELKYLVNKGDE